MKDVEGRMLPKFRRCSSTRSETVVEDAKIEDWRVDGPSSDLTASTKDL